MSSPTVNKYMNLMDTLLLIDAALVCLLIAQKPTPFHASIITALLSLPVMVIMLLLMFKFLKMIQKVVMSIKSCKHLWQWMKAVRESQQETPNQQLIAPLSTTTVGYGACA